MTPSLSDNKEAARARAQALRGERAARARTIRRRVISGAVALFVAAWLMITIMLVSGHDPALAGKASAASSATNVTSPGTTTSSSGSDSASSGVSSVTTSQS